MIDKDKLRELIAADPTAKTEPIWKGLGFKNDVTFYYHLKKDPEAKQIFTDAKKAAIAARDGEGRASARKPSKRAKKKAANRAAPLPQRSCHSGTQRRSAPEDSARV